MTVLCQVSVTEKCHRKRGLYISSKVHLGLLLADSGVERLEGEEISFHPLQKPGAPKQGERLTVDLLLSTMQAFFFSLFMPPCPASS